MISPNCIITMNSVTKDRMYVTSQNKKRAISW